VAFLIQLIGAVIVSGTKTTDANAQSKFSKGKNIALAGLATQIACFGLFSIIALRFNFTSNRFRTEFLENTKSEPGDKYFAVEGQKRKFKNHWQALLRVVNIVCTLILVRSVYRVVDFSLGKHGYTSSHEWT
jgi:hypothetical protein